MPNLIYNFLGVGNKESMKNQEEKKRWILDYMSDPEHKNEFIDITAEPFVNAYIDRFHPKIEWYPYGEPKVPELGKLLGMLYKEGKVWRYRHYCELWQDGYPRWFYVYHLMEM